MSTYAKDLVKNTMKGLFSPVGLTILSCLLIILLGVNPLILVFDLIVKSMNILSGSALISSIVNQTFTTSSPIFIIYITIFAISFIMIFFKIIKSGLNNSTSSKEFSTVSNLRKNSFSFFKIKWILIWLVSFFLMPFAFGIILFIIGLFSSLFGIQETFAAKLTIFNESDWNNSILDIKNTLVKTQTNITDFHNLLFPKDIDSVSLPQEFQGFDITEESWKNFLKILQNNTNAIEFKDALITSQLQINSILTLPIFKMNGNAALNLTINQTSSMINDLNENINKFNNFFSSTNLSFSHLQIALSTSIDNLVDNDVNNALKANAHLLIQSSNWAQDTFYNDNSLINETIGRSKLNGIAIYGLENQKISDSHNFIRLDNLTVQITSSLYQQPIYSIYMTNRTIWTSSFNNWNSIIETIVATFGFTFCFTTFWSLTLILIEKLFSYFGLLIIAPFSTSAGVSDMGDKFQLWFKSIFGKAITIFIVLLSVSLFGILINFITNFFSQASIISWLDRTDGELWYSILSQFLIVIIVIGLCSALLEFIGWSAMFFKFDLKNKKNKRKPILLNNHDNFKYQNKNISKQNNIQNQNFKATSSNTQSYYDFLNRKD